MNAGRDRALDGLRGLAALVVLVDHSFIVLPYLSGPAYDRWHTDGWERYVTDTPLRVFWAGLEAVFVFFILSGYVLTPQRARDRRGWEAYYPSRMLRLYLPVVASVLWALAFWSVWHPPLMGSRVTVRDIVRDCVLLRGVDSLNGPLWSLQWEVVFSLALPAYLLFARGARSWWPLKLAVIVAVIWVGLVTGHASLTYLPLFAIGVLLANHRLPHSLVERLQARRWIAATLAVAALLLTARSWIAFRFEPSVNAERAAFLAAIGGACVFMVVALVSEPARRFLMTPAVQWLGVRSFALYLVHWSIAATFAHEIPGRWSGFEIPATILTSLVAADVFFRFIEAPSHRASRAVRRVSSWRRADRVSA